MSLNINPPVGSSSSQSMNLPGGRASTEKAVKSSLESGSIPSQLGKDAHAQVVDLLKGIFNSQHSQFALSPEEDAQLDRLMNAETSIDVLPPNYPAPRSPAMVELDKLFEDSALTEEENKRFAYEELGAPPEPPVSSKNSWAAVEESMKENIHPNHLSKEQVKNINQFVKEKDLSIREENKKALDGIKQNDQIIAQDAYQSRLNDAAKAKMEKFGDKSLAISSKIDSINNSAPPVIKQIKVAFQKAKLSLLRSSHDKEIQKINILSAQSPRGSKIEKSGKGEVEETSQVDHLDKLLNEVESENFLEGVKAGIKESDLSDFDVLLEELKQEKALRSMPESTTAFVEENDLTDLDDLLGGLEKDKAIRSSHDDPVAAKPISIKSMDLAPLVDDNSDPTSLINQDFMTFLDGLDSEEAINDLDALLTEIEQASTADVGSLIERAQELISENSSGSLTSTAQKEIENVTARNEELARVIGNRDKSVIDAAKNLAKLLEVRKTPVDEELSLQDKTARKESFETAKGALKSFFEIKKKTIEESSTILSSPLNVKEEKDTQKISNPDTPLEQPKKLRPQILPGPLSESLDRPLTTKERAKQFGQVSNSSASEIKDKLSRETKRELEDIERLRADPET